MDLTKIVGTIVVTFIGLTFIATGVIDLQAMAGGTLCIFDSGYECVERARKRHQNRRLAPGANPWNNDRLFE